MFRISYFWQDWNSFVRLAVFHNAFSAKRSHSYFFSKICLKLLIIGFLACVAYCSAQLNRLETVPFAKSNRFASVSIDTYCSIKYVCKCLSIDTCTYIAQLNRFVRVSMSIIHCCDRVQNDGEAAFCGIWGYSIHAGLETVLYISEGKTNTNNIYPTWCSSVLLKTTDTLLLKYLIKEIGTDRKCQIPTSPVDINDNLLYFLKALQKK